MKYKMHMKDDLLGEINDNIKLPHQYTYAHTKNLAYNKSPSRPYFCCGQRKLKILGTQK